MLSAPMSMILMIVMMIDCCTGASLPTIRSPAFSSPFGALGLFFLTSHFFTLAGAVCPHCKDSIPGCAGGEACITVAGPRTNAGKMSSPSFSSVPDLASLLPPELQSVFSRPVVEAIVGIACAPQSGAIIDFSSAPYTKASSVVRAAMFGHCTPEEAILELSSRLDEAGSERDALRLSTSIELLRSKASQASSHLQNGCQGVFTFVWAKIGQAFSAREAGSIRLQVPGGRGPTSTDLSATVRRPGSSTEFYFWISQFIRVLHAIGVATFFVSSQFVKDVVWDTILRLKQSWQVAHELMLCYFRRVEEDPSKKLTLANVYQQGWGDVLMAEARCNAETFFGEITSLEPLSLDCDPDDDHELQMPENAAESAL